MVHLILFHVEVGLGIPILTSFRIVIEDLAVSINERAFQASTRTISAKKFFSTTKNFVSHLDLSLTVEKTILAQIKIIVKLEAYEFLNVFAFRNLKIRKFTHSIDPSLRNVQNFCNVARIFIVVKAILDLKMNFTHYRHFSRKVVETSI